MLEKSLAFGKLELSENGDKAYKRFVNTMQGPALAQCIVIQDKLQHVYPLEIVHSLAIGPGLW